MGVHNIELNNGVTIPQIGLGVFQTESGKQTVDAVVSAVEAGYRHIDTAKAYNNEESVGEGIRQSGVPREEIFITTKLWNSDVRAGRATEAFNRSLERLQVDYVDLYLIHWAVDGWQQAWQSLVDLYHQGRVRAIGVSNFLPHHLDELATLADVVPAVNQIESAPYFSNQALIDYAKTKGIESEAWSPLGGTGGTMLSDPKLVAIANRYGKSAAQAVIRWNLQRGVIVLPKSVHAERIRQNIDVFDFELSQEDMAEISALETGQRQGPDPDNITF